MTITTRWLYSVDGQAKYYQDGDYIYSKNGQREFSVSNGRWYAIKGGAAEYYVSDNWVLAIRHQRREMRQRRECEGGGRL